MNATYVTANEAKHT